MGYVQGALPIGAPCGMPIAGRWMASEVLCALGRSLGVSSRDSD